MSNFNELLTIDNGHIINLAISATDGQKVREPEFHADTGCKRCAITRYNRLDNLHASTPPRTRLPGH
jgi:hypothetical protein